MNVGPRAKQDPHAGIIGLDGSHNRHAVKRAIERNQDLRIH
ncbi:MAG: hypothetical protein ACRDLT_12405 [Solirubrobacteraceae bacterium]